MPLSGGELQLGHPSENLHTPPICMTDTSHLCAILFSDVSVTWGHRSKPEHSEGRRDGSSTKVSSPVHLQQSRAGTCRMCRRVGKKATSYDINVMSLLALNKLLQKDGLDKQSSRAWRPYLPLLKQFILLVYDMFGLCANMSVSVPLC